MRVVGAKVVAQFMGDHIQVPGIAVDVVVGGVVQVRAEPVGVGATIDPEIGDAPRACVQTLGDQVGDVPLHCVQGGIAFPSLAEVVKHGACIVDVGIHGVHGLPDVHIARLKKRQSIEFLGVNGLHSRHQGEGPFCGVGGIVEGRPGGKVDVQSDLDATAVNLAALVFQALLDPPLKPLLGIVSATRERGVVPQPIHVCHHIEVVFAVHQVVLHATVME